MVYYPIFIAFIMAVLNWISVEKKWKILEYVTKPGIMLVLIWWMWLTAGLGGGMTWFTLGAIFCLAGDIFLMIPKDMFIFGLLAFLVGQISYIVGFNDQSPYISSLGSIVFILLVFYISWLYPKLAKGLKEKGKSILLIPVLIYAIAISLMVYSALMTWDRAGWPDMAALSVSLGAVLFYISDSILAWDRFVAPISHGRTKNLMSYHLGQFGIILGAILHLI